MTVPASFGCLLLARHTIFSPASGLFVSLRDRHLLYDLREQDGASVVIPTALTVLIVADNHEVKTALIPGLGTWVKGRGSLQAWLKECGHQM